MGEALAVDGGVGVVEDGGGVAVLEGTGHHLALGLDQLLLGGRQVVLVDRPAQGGVAPGVDVGAQAVQVVGAEHPVRGRRSRPGPPRSGTGRAGHGPIVRGR